MRKLLLISAALALLLLLTGCAGSNLLQGTSGNHGVAGFWAGLWHGMIALPALIISFFNHHVSMYEVHNSGFGYNLGFLLGIGIGSGFAGNSSARRRDRD